MNTREMHLRNQISKLENKANVTDNMAIIAKLKRRLRALGKNILGEV